MNTRSVDVRRRAERRRLPGAVRTAGMLAVAVLLAAGCEDDPVAPDAIRVDDLIFRGGVDVRESFPVQLGFFLEAHDIGDEEVEIVHDECGMRPRAYRDADRAGPPAWDGRPEGSCLASGAPVSIPAGGTHRWTRDLSAGEILGDSLPDGRYHFTVTLGTVRVAGTGGGRFVEVTAGAATLEVPR